MGTDAGTMARSPGVRQEIESIAEGIKQHRALDNDFYSLWMSKRLSADQVALFARNFYERVSNTPNRIALAFLHMSDSRARAETVENLYDEMGNGNPDHAHVTILREFFETLLGKLYAEPVNFDQLKAPVLPTTRTLVAAGDRLFSSPDPARVCGALLAQEWHAYTQLVCIYEGARNYMDLFEREEFHDSCGYFYLHIGAAEKEHKVHAVSTAAQMCLSGRDLVSLREGFGAYLDLLADNWDELYKEIQSLPG